MEKFVEKKSSDENRCSSMLRSIACVKSPISGTLLGVDFWWGNV